MGVFMLTLMLVSIIFFVAGFIQGLSGFGSALIAMPLLTFFLDVKIAVPLCILNGLLITSYLSLQLKSSLDKKKIFPLFIGCLPGVFLGVIFLKNTSSLLIELLLGVLIICYGIFAMIFHPKPRKIHAAWSYLAGFCTGFIGSTFSAGGPPTIIYTTLTDWSRDHIKATLSCFFFLSGVIIAIVHAVNGLINTLIVTYFFVTGFFVLLGTYTGSMFYSRINRQKYIQIILIVLVMLGAMMGISSLLEFMGL
jgi:uncharacterized membrane protein YfcA